VRRRLPRVAATLIGALAAFAATGCGNTLDQTLRDNQPPYVRLTQAPASTTDPTFYAYHMSWVGYDPDGRVAYYRIAVDPPSVDVVDSTWQKTTEHGRTFYFRATQPDTIGLVRATDLHTFAIVAVDDRGTASKPLWRSFNSYTVAPLVRIELPRPSASITPIVTPAVQIRWSGTDPDGQFQSHPVKYKFHLFRPRDPDFPGVNDAVAEVLAHPKLIRWKYAPTFGPSDSCPTCSYWDSCSGDTTETRFTGLIPGTMYAFAVTALDEAGAYDPIFSQESNLLRFVVTNAGSVGPILCMFNNMFNFCYTSGGYSNDPTRAFSFEVSADQTLTFNWSATPSGGAEMRRYRWALDLQDLSDNTPRDSQSDWYHWSDYGLLTTSASVGPFRTNAEVHQLFIEAEDTNGLRSLGILHFTIVKPTFERDLLFVDDTRLTPDAVSSGVVQPPRGPWPTAAELDTFFFARGGAPWKGYPAGTLSQRGIFAGFQYDTIGTRGIVSGIVPLSLLGRYRTVVWYVDDVGATFTGAPTSSTNPVASLRRSSSPSQNSTLATYLNQGGNMWLFGGGAAAATLLPWKVGISDGYTAAGGDLVPGRFMYDFTHWRAAVMVRPASFAVFNTPSLRPPYPNAAPGRGYEGHGIHHDLSMPNYAQLLNDVPFLSPRTCSSDPPSPLRDCGSFYLVSYYTGELMGSAQAPLPNPIVEDADPSGAVRMESTLDTLYFCLGGTAPYGRPIMTYYHGFESPQEVFSGFPLWHFQRAQARALAAFVLRDIFRIAPQGPASSVSAASRPSPRASAATSLRLGSRTPPKRGGARD
jgi:hypothetical protein